MFYKHLLFKLFCCCFGYLFCCFVKLFVVVLQCYFVVVLQLFVVVLQYYFIVVFTGLFCSFFQCDFVVASLFCCWFAALLSKTISLHYLRMPTATTCSWYDYKRFAKFITLLVWLHLHGKL